MKNLIYIFGFVVFVCGCNQASPKINATEDSLNYYPPSPAGIDQQEFRQYHRTVSAFFDSTLVNKGFNGSILIAKEGNIIYEKYVGFRDLRSKDAITDTTSFHLASTSKPFTAMALLRMVQEGKLSLNDSLTKFFPGFPYPGVTVKMLLNHRSGLPNYVHFVEESKKWDKKKYMTNEDLLQFMYREKPMRSFPPDKRFSYSNTNYALLAMIIEKISGMAFPDYMKTHLFEPLQMTHTFVFTQKDSLTATPSFEANGRFWPNDFLEYTYGDKNVYSTPKDMLKWDQALYTDQFINKTLLDSAFAPYSFEKPGIHNYGLGWRMLLMPNGKKVIYHFGRWHGFTPAFARLTDEKVTIIILGNKFNRNIYNAAHLSYDLFGDYMQKHSSEEDEAEPAQSKKKVVAEKKKEKKPIKPAPAKTKSAKKKK